VSKPYILVVDDEPDIRHLVREILEDEGYEVATAENAVEARRLYSQHRPDLALLDIWMPDVDGITLLKEWVEGLTPLFPVIMMSGHATVETAVEATRTGAFDFLEKPLSLARLLLTVERALEFARLRRENQGIKSLSDEIAEPVGRGAVIEQLKAQIRRLARHDARVLLVGEPGCGKETLARYLHASSDRREGPFVEVGVGAIAPEFAAVDFFGREEDGRVYPGLLEKAHGGVLYLDEVADMEEETQLRLLGALESRSFLRVGGTESLSVEARVVASTCKSLEEEVRAGRFRKDLYYLLNAVTLTVPPLRQHAEDVPELLNYYIDYFVTREKLSFRHFLVATQNFLRNYAWPGNVRELKNLVQRLLILGNGEDIGIEEVRIALGDGARREENRDGASPNFFDLPLKDAREGFEKAYLEHHLERSGGNVAKLAALVGVERTHLYRKLNSLGIRFKEKP
jgi:DNA-binding NtrC family response regulator